MWGENVAHGEKMTKNKRETQDCHANIGRDDVAKIGAHRPQRPKERRPTISDRDRNDKLNADGEGGRYDDRPAACRLTASTTTQDFSPKRLMVFPQRTHDVITTSDFKIE